MNQTKLIGIKEELKQALNDYNYSLKHNSELTIQDIELMLEEINSIKQLLLQESASLEAKLRKLSILADAD